VLDPWGGGEGPSGSTAGSNFAPRDQRPCLARGAPGATARPLARARLGRGSVGTRTQQRAIPPLVVRLLDEFGDEAYDGHGAIRVYFSHSSRRRTERAFGRHAAQLFTRHLHAYKVEATDGHIIAKGWRTVRLKRR
jgi:hypothetical protein